jgi:hypothetical protein
MHKIFEFNKTDCRFPYLAFPIDLIHGAIILHFEGNEQSLECDSIFPESAFDIIRKGIFFKVILADGRAIDSNWISRNLTNDILPVVYKEINSKIIYSCFSDENVLQNIASIDCFAVIANNNKYGVYLIDPLNFTDLTIPWELFLNDAEHVYFEKLEGIEYLYCSAVSLLFHKKTNLYFDNIISLSSPTKWPDSEYYRPMLINCLYEKYDTKYFSYNISKVSNIWLLWYDSEYEKERRYFYGNFDVLSMLFGEEIFESSEFDLKGPKNSFKFDTLDDSMEYLICVMLEDDSNINEFQCFLDGTK